MTPATRNAAPRHAAMRRATVAAGRVDIQGLRAIAVVLVVVYHLWPWRLTGGYVGVDVFFVISGFLITSHLMREVDRTGSVRLAQFWARRARRLLPASLLVLAVTLGGMAFAVPSSLWGQFGREIAASALYVENFALAVDSVDYLGADNAPSPVQHYWSLSVEEQFYLVWPLLIVAALWWGRRSTRLRTAVAVVLGVVTAASLVASAMWTSASPAQAYFVTPTRAWEFGAGALLALVPLRAFPRGVRAAVAWMGLALIVLAAFTFDGQTPFPGTWALLPVVGAVLVLWADADSVAGSPSTVLRWRPIQATGDVSYSVYLWHWPAIILATYALGREPALLGKLGLVVLIAAASYATWRWVENPVRQSRKLTSARPQVTFALTAGGMVSILAAAWWMGSTVGREADASLAESDSLLDQVAEGPAETSSAPTPCIGAAVVATAAPCEATLDESAVVPVPAAARLDSPDDCLAVKGTDEFAPCEFGVPRNGSAGTIALVGDSHAYHWLPALQDLAEEYGWHGIVMARESCPYTPADRTLEAAVVDTCSVFNERVTAEIARRADVSAVVMAAFSDIYFDAPDGADEREYAREQYERAIAELPAHVDYVHVVRDAPEPRPDNVECVEAQLAGGASALGAASACAASKADALHADVLAQAAGESARATTIDLSDLYCDQDSCYPVVGNVMVYADQGHLTRTWVRTAAPELERQMSIFGGPS